jgi:lipid A 3-O-deacylase
MMKSCSRRHLFILGLLSSTILSSPARLYAEESADSTFTEHARDAGVFTLYYENDVFSGEDRHYTNGFKFSWLSGDLSDWGQTGWRQSVIDRLPFVNDPGTQKNFGLAFGQFMYTPQDISADPPDPADRPYAGWSYLELTFIAKTAKVMDSLSIQMGMVGRASQADEFQRAIHNWLNDEEPMGWDYQLQNEFGMNIVYERKWRLYARAFDNHLGADLIPHAGFSLGNVDTFANAGFTLRLGFNLPSDFGVSTIRGASLPNGPIDDNDPRVSPNRNWSFFVFGGGDGRAVARNIFLDGNTFRESASVDKEPFVGDAFYGVGVIAGRWQLTYMNAVRSLEFEGQRGKNYYGSLMLSFTF